MATASPSFNSMSSTGNRLAYRRNSRDAPKFVKSFHRSFELSGVRKIAEVPLPDLNASSSNSNKRTISKTQGYTKSLLRSKTMSRVRPTSEAPSSTDSQPTTKTSNKKHGYSKALIRSKTLGRVGPSQASLDVKSEGALETIGRTSTDSNSKKPIDLQLMWNTMQSVRTEEDDSDEIRLQNLLFSKSQSQSSPDLFWSSSDISLGRSSCTDSPTSVRSMSPMTPLKNEKKTILCRFKQKLRNGRLGSLRALRKLFGGKLGSMNIERERSNSAPPPPTDHSPMVLPPPTGYFVAGHRAMYSFQQLSGSTDIDY